MMPPAAHVIDVIVYFVLINWRVTLEMLCVSWPQNMTANPLNLPGIKSKMRDTDLSIGESV